MRRLCFCWMFSLQSLKWGLAVLVLGGVAVAQHIAIQDDPKKVAARQTLLRAAGAAAVASAVLSIIGISTFGVWVGKEEAL